MMKQEDPHWTLIIQRSSLNEDTNIPLLWSNSSAKCYKVFGRQKR